MVRSVIFISILTLPMVTLGQTLGGSAYSAFGIGELQSPGFGAYTSMGNVGIGARHPSYANTINPAALNAFQAGSKVFDFGVYAGMLNQTSQNIRETKGDGGLSHLNLLIKPKPNLGFSLGLKQVSKVDYNITSENISDPQLGLLNIEYDGSGGLTQLDLGSSFSPIKNLNFGIRGSVFLGSINEVETVTSDSEIRRFSVLSRQVYAKAIFDMGVQYDIRLDKSNLTLGATWNPDFQAFSRSIQVISNDSGDTLSTPLDSELTIPQSFGFGASWRKSNLMVSADVGLQLWETYNDESDNSSYNNVFKVGLGTEYIINPTSPDYWDQIRWRAGLGFNNYYQNINGDSFDEMSLSLGFGLPARGGSLINFGYEYSLRGTTANDLIRETGHMFSLSFTFRELWFAKRIVD